MGDWHTHEDEIAAINLFKKSSDDDAEKNRVASLLLSRACNEIIMAVRSLSVQMEALKNGKQLELPIPDPLEFVEKAQNSIISASTLLDRP